ncbi:MAG: hypothetical protein J6M43_06970 [Neisseriaceae bacterium]|nr:hypothetical protein [Neisseriaceae bacterium]
MQESKLYTCLKEVFFDNLEGNIWEKFAELASVGWATCCPRVRMSVQAA